MCSVSSFLQAPVGLLDDAVDLVVDLRRLDLGIALARRGNVTSKEDLAVVRAVVDRADLLAHAVAGDHRTRHLGRLLDIAVRTGRDILHRQLFRHTAAQADDDILLHVAAVAVWPDPPRAAAW